MTSSESTVNQPKTQVEENIKNVSIILSDKENKGHCNSASSKEKTPMCLVNEMARHNRIPHQYRLTHEDGPAHKKIFTVTLKLGDEEYQADGSSIKKAQHCAASLALESTAYKHPPEKTNKELVPRRNITPTVELNALAMKRGELTEYTLVESPPNAPENLDSKIYLYKSRGRGRVIGGRIYKGPRGNFISRGKYVRALGSYNYQDDFEGEFKVLLKVSDREYTGFGPTPQLAKHDAASQALEEMKKLVEQDENNDCDGDADNVCTVCPGERKSPVSLVHEMALKRKLQVVFEVVEEKGQPHMRIYCTKCIVGKYETIGEGNGKKISKSKAAELMLDELKKEPLPVENRRFKKRIMNNDSVKGKRKSRTQKTSENQEVSKQSDDRNEMCSIAFLRQYQLNRNESEPIFEIIDVKNIPKSKKKEFTAKVTIGDKNIIAVSNNKKAAMRNAAKLLLIDLGVCTKEQKKKVKKPTTEKKKKKEKPKPDENVKDIDIPNSSSISNSSDTKNNCSPVKNGTNINASLSNSTPISKGKNMTEISNSPVANCNPDQSETLIPTTPTGGPGGRQLVPGMILVSQNTPKTPDSSHLVNVEKTAKIAQEYLATGSSPTAEALNRRRRTKKQNISTIKNPKDQLIYLSQISGFQITYSDFPNPNQPSSGNQPTQGFLSLVSLSTNPPQVCHGVGSNTEESQIEAAISALKFLSEMKLQPLSSLSSSQNCVPLNSSNRLFNTPTPLTPHGPFNGQYINIRKSPIQQSQQ